MTQISALYAVKFIKFKFNFTSFTTTQISQSPVHNLLPKFHSMAYNHRSDVWTPLNFPNTPIATHKEHLHATPRNRV